MILSGLEIIRNVELGSIKIEPFNAEQVNPNSYDLRLHGVLMTNNAIAFDMKKAPAMRELLIPEDGLYLMPNRLYLGRTVEYTETHGFVPQLSGKSSTGRVGMAVHVTAGFGDVGFCGHWTLELFVVEPVRIYPNMRVCQIAYFTVSGDHREYNGRYKNMAGGLPIPYRLLDE